MRVALPLTVLTVLLLASPIQAGPLPELGPYAGTIGDGHLREHAFSTHGDNPCLEVWIPKLYIVTLAYVTPTDTLTLTARGVAAAGADGTAVVKFVANYCTAFTISVAGTAVDGIGGTGKDAYVVTVHSVFTGPTLG